MILAEITDSVVEYRVVDATASKFKTVATIKDRMIRFVAKQHYDESLGWDIEFEEEAPDGRWTLKTTNSGGAFEVASFITKSLREFVQRYSPDVMTFSAEKFNEDDARPAVYAKLLARQFKDYDVAEKNKGNTVVFVMRRL